MQFATQMQAAPLQNLLPFFFTNNLGTYHTHIKLTSKSSFRIMISSNLHSLNDSEHYDTIFIAIASRRVAELAGRRGRLIHITFFRLVTSLNKIVLT